MPTDVVMPQMGESITEGTLTKWLKKPGDTVARDEPLFEISTDKVDAEIPSPAAGTLGEINGRKIGFVEHLLVHMLANDADPHSVQRPLVREASIGLRRQPADAERCQLIIQVVAGDDFEHAGSILDGAAQRSHSRVQCRGDHSVATDQFLSRGESHKAVVLGGVMDGSPGFLSDGARHQVCGHR